MSHSHAEPINCPSCRSGQVRVFYEAPSVPVNSVLLLSTREQALSFPTGDIRLGFCEDCGFIYNTCFERRLVEYSSRCEETQGFSPLFRAWHEDLARRLIDRYDLHGKRVVEIGCGKGEFLALLCELGDNHGIGFDPAYIPERTAAALARRIRFIPDLYTNENCGVSGDFLCCKMTLEHIADTADFIRLVYGSLRHSAETCVFFQVPDVTRVLEEQAFWDIYYEHCSYFSAGSLAGLFCRTGFEILDVSREYSGQYITIEARPRRGTARSVAPEDDMDSLRGVVDRFASQVPMRIGEWRRRLGDYQAKGLKTVIWGAGSKGVTFLSTVNIPGAVEYAVDINPHMSGHFLGKSGTEIVQPSFLHHYHPDVVIVMNPVYHNEIVAELARIGRTPEVISA